MKRIVVIAVVCVLFGAGLWAGLAQRDQRQVELLMRDGVITVLPTPRPLTDFRLHDQAGKPFGLRNLAGKLTLMFFGYTHCPDICPTTLATLNQLHRELAKQADGLKDLQIVFVSVDPGRDDPATLGKYVEFFNKDFIGTSGEKAQIATLAGQLGVHYEVLDTAGTSDYGVNHSAAVFVIDQKARFVGLMTPPLEAAAMASRVDLVRKMSGLLK